MVISEVSKFFKLSEKSNLQYKEMLQQYNNGDLNIEELVDKVLSTYNIIDFDTYKLKKEFWDKLQQIYVECAHRIVYNEFDSLEDFTSTFIKLYCKKEHFTPVNTDNCKDIKNMLAQFEEIVGFKINSIDIKGELSLKIDRLN